MQYSAQDIADLINQAADSDPFQRSDALKDIAQASDFSPFRQALSQLAGASESVQHIRKNAMDTIFKDCSQTKGCPADYIPLFVALLSNPQEAKELHNKILNCLEIAAENAAPQNGIDPQLEKLLIKTATGKNHIGEPIMKNTNIRGRPLDAMFLQIEAMGDDTTYRTAIHDMMDETKESAPDIRGKATSTLGDIVVQVTRDITPHVSAFDRATDIQHESHEGNRKNALLCLNGLIQDKIKSDVWETTVARNLSYSTDGQRTPYETDDELREVNADIIVDMALSGHNPSSGHKILTGAANPKTGDKADLTRVHFLDSLSLIAHRAAGKDLVHYITLLKDSTDPLTNEVGNRRMAANLLDKVIATKGKIDTDEEAILLRGMESTLEGDADVRMGMIKAVQNHIIKIGVAQFQQEHPRIIASLMHAESHDPSRAVKSEAGIALSHLQNHGSGLSNTQAAAANARTSSIYGTGAGTTAPAPAPPPPPPPPLIVVKGVRLDFNTPNNLDPYADNHAANVANMFNNNAGNPISAKVYYSTDKKLPEGTDIRINIQPAQSDAVKEAASAKHPEFKLERQADGTFNAILTETPGF